MMLRLVCAGSRRRAGDGTVSKLLLATVMEGEDGLMGVGVRLCARYQAKIWWPNLEGFEEAPATAMCGLCMKVRAAVCIVGSVGGISLLLLLF